MRKVLSWILKQVANIIISMLVFEAVDRLADRVFGDD